MPTAYVAIYPIKEARSAARLLAGANLTVVGLTEDGRTALREIPVRAPDLLLTSAVLPGYDGFALAKAFDCAALVLSLWEGDAAVIRPPLTEQSLNRALFALTNEPPEAARLRARTLLDEMGFRDGALIVEAVAFACVDPSVVGELGRALYPKIARRNGLTASQTARKIARGIEHAWSRGNADAQYNLFLTTVDAARAKPTPGLLIARLSQKLRLEGFGWQKSNGSS